MPRQLLDEKNIPIKYQDSKLTKRRAVLIDTVQKFELSQDDYQKKARENHARWKESCADHREAIHRIEVKQGDWGTVTQALSAATGEIYAVLNMANAHVPGGGYLEGMVAQEENMFRRTDCHFYVEDQHMDVTRSRYTPEITKLINGENGYVFLDTKHPRVCIKRQEDPDTTGYDDLPAEELFMFYELKSAADDLRHGKHFSEENTRRKITAQLDTLISKGVRHVVLSAFGCGAFQNPPEPVARIYREELQKKGEHFDHVVFAIYYAGYGSENFIPFKKVLNGVSLKPNPALEQLLQGLAKDLNSPKWDKEGYRFAFFNFRKTPDGIVMLRQELHSTNDPKLKFQKIQEIAQYRLDHPPKYTPRAKVVHKLYQQLTCLSMDNLATVGTMRLQR